MKQRFTKRGRKYQRELSDNPYVNGITGVDGNLAIRPLNDEEFEFLEKFNNEFVMGNFERDANGKLTENNLHYPLVNGTEDSISKLKADIKITSEKLRESNNYREMNDRKAYWKYKKNLYKEYSKLKAELEAIDVVKNIDADNYARRSDLMTYVGKDQRTVLITDNFSNTKYATNEEDLFEYVESSKI